MKHWRSLLVLTALLCGLAAAQDVKVKVRAALYDRDLNVKPVPRLLIKLVPATPGAQPLTVQTSLDGLAEIEIPPGKYKVITEKSVELFDKSYRWEFEASFTSPENTLELSNDNAQATPLAAARDARVDALAYQYQRVKNTVVNVWTEHGPVDGFVVDSAGLVMTIFRPVERAGWMAVQIDDQRRLAAVLVASDKVHDIAVLQVNPAASGPLVAAPLANDPGSLIEGERVFMVENPGLERNKKLVSGVVSKADAEEIVSDVNGYVGGALFNSSGSIVGMGDVRERKFRIQPIAIAGSVIAEARQKIAAASPPSSQLLPTDPTDSFPFEGLRAPGRGHWEKEMYSFQAGDFFVELFTPVALYEAANEEYEQALKQYNKSKGRASPPAEPEHKYQPVLIIGATPKTKMPFWENFGSERSGRPIVLRYKNAFDKMRLLCGQKEVTPVWPGLAVAERGSTRRAVLEDESSGGQYVYLSDSVSPQCEKVILQIFSAKDPEHPVEKVLDPKIVARIWEDFEPYRKIHARPADASSPR